MVTIKDMKMPSSCYDCPFVKNERTNDYGSFCECGILEDYETINLLEHSKHPDCPLTEQESILDKIRAEIEQIPTKTRINWDGCCPDIDYPEIEYVDVTKNKLLSIIDKYRTESE